MLGKIFKSWYYSGATRSSLSPATVVELIGRIRYSLELVSPRGKDILVVGDSYGWYAHYALERGAKLVHSLDIAQPSPAINNLKKQHKNFDHFVASILDFSPSQKYSYCVFLEVIEHLPVGTEVEALKKIAASLNSRGTMLLSTPSTSALSYLSDPAVFFGHRHYSASRLTKLLRQAGFDNIEITTGGFFFSALNVINMYFTKWVLRKEYNSLFTQRVDKEFPCTNGNTLFAVCRK